MKLFSYYLEVLLQKINYRNKKLLISKKNFVNIIVFNRVSITITILLNKIKLIINCVFCYKKNLTNCEVIVTCITIII